MFIRYEDTSTADAAEENQENSKEGKEGEKDDPGHQPTSEESSNEEIPAVVIEGFQGS